MSHKPKKSAESKKIAKLIRDEGKTPREAAGEAYGMARAGRLTKSGGYRRVKRRKGSRR